MKRTLYFAYNGSTSNGKSGITDILGYQINLNNLQYYQAGIFAQIYDGKENINYIVDYMNTEYSSWEIVQYFY